MSVLTADAGLNLAQLGLLDALTWLQARGYQFTTIKPSSHRRVLEREERPARNLRDFLGWSRPAREADLDPELVAMLRRGGAISAEGDQVRSTVRVSSVAGQLFLHSAYPARAQDAVFLGPDSYRFAAFIDAAFPRGQHIGRIVDIGAGAGVGGVVAAGLAPNATLEITDINPEALRLAVVNCAAAGLSAQTHLGPGLGKVAPGIDLAVANPPFMAGPSTRIYSKGGGRYGEQLSLDWAAQALEKLRPGGRLLLYTGSAIREGGADLIHDRLAALARGRGAGFDYREIDPDIFGEVLGGDAYCGVERIAAVGAVLIKR